MTLQLLSSRLLLLLLIRLLGRTARATARALALWLYLLYLLRHLWCCSGKSSRSRGAAGACSIGACLLLLGLGLGLGPCPLAVGGRRDGHRGAAVALVARGHTLLLLLLGLISLLAGVVCLLGLGLGLGGSGDSRAEASEQRRGGMMLLGRLRGSSRLADELLLLL